MINILMIINVVLLIIGVIAYYLFMKNMIEDATRIMKDLLLPTYFLLKLTLLLIPFNIYTYLYLEQIHNYSQAILLLALVGFYTYAINGYNNLRSQKG